MKYIDADKLKEKIEKKYLDAKEKARFAGETGTSSDCTKWNAVVLQYENVLRTISSLQQKQPCNMIQWTGNNLKEVIDFTGKSSRFGEWFKSWEDYENYVHTHNDILKLFCEDGSHYEVPVGAWIVKTPDGYNLPSVAKYIKQEQPESGSSEKSNNLLSEKQERPEVDLEKEINRYCGTRDIRPVPDFMDAVARHFFELGLTFMARMFYQYPNVARLWYEQLPKTTMD